MPFPRRRAREEFQRTSNPLGTKLYLPSTGTAAVSPSFRGGWEDTTSMPPSRRVLIQNTPSGTAMTTLSLVDADASDRDVLIGQWVSRPIDGDQTITNQDLFLVVRASETDAANNLFVTWAVYVVSNDGSSVRGVLIDVVRDDVEVATSLTNRYLTSIVSQISALDGDRVVLELGVGGDPAVNHSSSIRVGDAAVSDLPYNDTETGDLNPFLQFGQVLSFRSEVSVLRKPYVIGAGMGGVGYMIGA